MDGTGVGSEQEKAAHSEYPRRIRTYNLLIGKGIQLAVALLKPPHILR